MKGEDEESHRSDNDNEYSRVRRGYRGTYHDS